MGLLVVAQSRINGELAHLTGDGVLAAVISFGTGLVLVSLIAMARRTTRQALVRELPRELRARRLRPWQLLGGLGGATLVAGQGLTVPALGVALFTVLVVAGQTGSSLVVDHVGLGPGGPRAITTARVVGAVGSTLAVALAVSGRFAAGSLAWSAVVLTVTAGIAISVQQAVNAQVAMRTGDPFAATLVNFVVGTTALVVLLLVVHAVGEQPWVAPPAPWSRPLLWLGGSIGVVFVVTAARVVRSLGVLLFSLLSIAGQLTGSLVSDLLLPTAGTVVSWQLVTGVLLTGAAIAFAALRR